MENKLKLRLSRIFQTSFGSCRTKNESDVVEQPFFFPENRHHRQLIDLFSPKPQPPFPSNFCKPKASETEQPASENRPKISDRNTLLISSDTGKCPPITSLHQTVQTHPKKANIKKTRNRKTSRKSQTNEFFSSVTSSYYGNWYSSDEEEDYYYYDDETTLFSSRSLSSDSSASFRKHKARLAEKKAKKKESGRRMGIVSLEGNGRVTDSFAVVKKSSDPHSDFRTSMVEMIVEKQIFGAQDLENLLQCFLSLNSDQHHRVIVEVFTEILDALFSDFS